MKNYDHCRVLIADDDELLRNLLASLLSDMGAKVVGEAENGEKAVQAFIEHDPDITFLDIKMPVKNGIDALKEIIEKDPNATVVMLTATSDISVADSCVELGAKQYIRKGIAPGVLKHMLKAALDLVS